MKELIDRFVVEATTKGTIYVESKDDTVPFGKSNNIGNTTVLVTGNNFTVREEADINKIASALQSMANKQTYSVRGRY